MKRISENPPARYPNRAIADAQLPWWVAKVKPRQEKALAFDFIANNIEYYLPLVTHVTRRKDNNKPRKSVLPLFPGYISFCAREPHADGVYKTGRIVSIIEIRNQQHFCRELGQIAATLETGVRLEPVGESLPPGTPVCIQTGQLRGICGTIISLHGTNRLVLSVTGLGQASMIVDAASVSPIKQSL